MGQLRGRAGVFVSLAIVAVAIGGLMGRVETPIPALVQESDPGAPAQLPADSETVRVHVFGMVVAPGVVDVRPDAIVADAIDAAGGLLPEARVDQINLAAPVTAGAQIVVPGGDGPSAGPEPPRDGGVLSINAATVGDLEALPGVGPVLAERIVAFREENGGFDVVEDLLQVPGIGEAKLAAMRDLVRP